MMHAAGQTLISNYYSETMLNFYYTLIFLFYFPACCFARGPKTKAYTIALNLNGIYAVKKSSCFSPNGRKYCFQNYLVKAPPYVNM